jgi:D-amino peptidase
VVAVRVLVSVDMEGIAGVVDPDDIRPGHGECERNRILLTAETNAAIRGVHVFDANAQVLVAESGGTRLRALCEPGHRLPVAARPGQRHAVE